MLYIYMYTPDSIYTIQDYICSTLSTLFDLYVLYIKRTIENRPFGLFFKRPWALSHALRML